MGVTYNSAGGAISIVYTPLAMRFRGVPVLTNTPPTGAQRGPGQNQLACAVEPIMDKAARQLGLDLVTIRRINAPDNSARYGARPGSGHQRIINVRRSTLGRSSSTGKPGVRAVDSGVARRSPASRSARRTTRPGITDSTGSCASHRTESCTSTPAWGTWVRIRTPARPGSPRRCSVTTGENVEIVRGDSSSEIFPGL